MEVLDANGWEAVEAPDTTRKEMPWREAVDAFIAAGFAPGDVIKHIWFYDAFHLVPPANCRTVQDAQQSQLRYLSNIDALKAELLEEHQIALRSARGVGYEIVPPSEQTSWAMDEARQDFRKVLRTSTARLAYIQLECLTDAEKKANLDARAKLAFFKKEARKSLA